MYQLFNGMMLVALTTNNLGILWVAMEAATLTTVLLVSGTVTYALAPAVRGAWERAAAEGPVRVLAFGACATGGGPYWDAPTVVPGVDSLIPVERYVPGCPPGPDALVAALRRDVT